MQRLCYLVFATWPMFFTAVALVLVTAAVLTLALLSCTEAKTQVRSEQPETQGTKAKTESDSKRKPKMGNMMSGHSEVTQTSSESKAASPNKSKNVEWSRIESVKSGPKDIEVTLRDQSKKRVPSSKSAESVYLIDKDKHMAEQRKREQLKTGRGKSKRSGRSSKSKRRRAQTNPSIRTARPKLSQRIRNVFSRRTKRKPIRSLRITFVTDPPTRKAKRSRTASARLDPRLALMDSRREIRHRQEKDLAHRQEEERTAKEHKSKSEKELVTVEEPPVRDTASYRQGKVSGIPMLVPLKEPAEDATEEEQTKSEEQSSKEKKRHDEKRHREKSKRSQRSKPSVQKPVSVPVPPGDIGKQETSKRVKETKVKQSVKIEQRETGGEKVKATIVSGVKQESTRELDRTKTEEQKKTSDEKRVREKSKRSERSKQSHRSPSGDAIKDGKEKSIQDEKPKEKPTSKRRSSDIQSKEKSTDDKPQERPVSKSQMSAISTLKAVKQEGIGKEAERPKPKDSKRHKLGEPAVPTRSADNKKETKNLKRSDNTSKSSKVSGENKAASDKEKKTKRKTTISTKKSEKTKETTKEQPNTVSKKATKTSTIESSKVRKSTHRKPVTTDNGSKLKTEKKQQVSKGRKDDKDKNQVSKPSGGKATGGSADKSRRREPQGKEKTVRIHMVSPPSAKASERTKRGERSGEISLQLQPHKIQLRVGGEQVKHRLINNSKYPVALKLKCSDNKLYTIEPTYGLAAPGESLSVSLQRHKGVKKMDKFIVEAIKVSEIVNNAKEEFRKKDRSTPKRFEYILNLL